MSIKKDLVLVLTQHSKVNFQVFFFKTLKTPPPEVKYFFFESDKETLSYVFENCVEAARKLTPKRCERFTDEELSHNKNLQHIRRVINKGVLTTTEKGKFYVFQNPGYSNCLDLMPWGVNLRSSAGVKQITKHEREMMKLPNFKKDIIAGILLSDGSLYFSNRGVNYVLKFQQSIAKSSYVLFVFNHLSHYCSSYPKVTIGILNVKKTYVLGFYTRAFPFFTEFYNIFYLDGVKRIPFEIYKLLTPVSLAHLIMADGTSLEYGLEIFTDCYPLTDVIRLLNALVIRY